MLTEDLYDHDVDSAFIPGHLSPLPHVKACCRVCHAEIFWGGLRRERGVKCGDGV